MNPDVHSAVGKKQGPDKEEGGIRIIFFKTQMHKQAYCHGSCGMARDKTETGIIF